MQATKTVPTFFVITIKILNGICIQPGCVLLYHDTMWVLGCASKDCMLQGKTISIQSFSSDEQ